MLAPVVVGTIIFMVWGEAFLHELGTDTHRHFVLPTWPYKKCNPPLAE